MDRREFGHAKRHRVLRDLSDVRKFDGARFGAKIDENLRRLFHQRADLRLGGGEIPV